MFSIESEELRLLRLDKVCKDGLDFQDVLTHITDKIRFLENLYRADKVCGFAFSQDFNDAALKERNMLCVTSSAIHKIIRDEERRKADAEYKLQQINS